MKIAISGKGGVGKTTIAAGLARLFEEDGRKVIAIDADPDANLALALGMPLKEASAIVPLSDMNELIEERTGAKPGFSGGFFKLNPKVEDIPERFGVTQGGIRVLVVGTVESGGGGCICPESALVRSLLRHLVLHRDEVVIMDMEAGIEHLGRSTAESVDALVLVVEPSVKSIQTAGVSRRLAAEIGITRVLAVANKVRGPEEAELVSGGLPEVPLIGIISDNEAIRRADIEGRSATTDAKFKAELGEIKRKLQELSPQE